MVNILFFPHYDVFLHYIRCSSFIYFVKTGPKLHQRCKTGSGNLKCIRDSLYFAISEFVITGLHCTYYTCFYYLLLNTSATGDVRIVLITVMHLLVNGVVSTQHATCYRDFLLLCGQAYF